MMARFQSGALGNVEYSFIAITPKSTLIQNGSAYWGSIYEPNRNI